jgi:hypothetical protein
VTNFLANVVDLARATAHEVLAHLPGVIVTEPAPGTCAVGRPHPATDGLLCRDHLEEIGRWLRDVQDETDRLDAAPSLAIRWDAGGGGLASQQAPVVLDAVVISDARSAAHGWQHIGPVCPVCPTLASARCTCPPVSWRRQDHWTGCPRAGAHPSCLHILADVDEHDARAERLLSVIAVLNSWAARVRRERMLAMPVVEVFDRIPGAPAGPYCPDPCAHDSCQGIRWIRTVPVAPTVAGERDLLTRQLETWIARQPWVIDFRHELADLRAQLLRVNRNEDDRPLTGWCYKHVDDQGTECGGNLWPVYTEHTSGADVEDDDGPRRPREVVCDRNPSHRWTGGKGGDLARLLVVLEQQRRAADPASFIEDPTPTRTRPAGGTPVDRSAASGRLAPLLDQQRREEQQRREAARP